MEYSDLKTLKCSYCETFSHGTNKNLESRKHSCLAFNHTCGYCQRQHHFDHICRSRDKTKLRLSKNQTVCSMLFVPSPLTQPQNLQWLTTVMINPPIYRRNNLYVHNPSYHCPSRLLTKTTLNLASTRMLTTPNP